MISGIWISKRESNGLVGMLKELRARMQNDIAFRINRYV